LMSSPGYKPDGGHQSSRSFARSSALGFVPCAPEMVRANTNTRRLSIRAKRRRLVRRPRREFINELLLLKSAGRLVVLCAGVARAWPVVRGRRTRDDDGHQEDTTRLAACTMAPAAASANKGSREGLALSRPIGRSLTRHCAPGRPLVSSGRNALVEVDFGPDRSKWTETRRGRARDFSDFGNLCTRPAGWLAARQSRRRTRLPSLHNAKGNIESKCSTAGPSGRARVTPAAGQVGTQAGGVACEIRPDGPASALAGERASESNC
jgi:hypothetical protein